MNIFGVLCTILTAGLTLALPRRWVVIPFLVAVFYVPRSQIVDLGGLNFPLIRVLALVGFVRIIAKKERIAGSFNLLDRMFVIWSVWFFIAIFLHENPPTFSFFGELFTDLGLYFLCRCFVHSREEFDRVCLFVSILLVPVAIAMLLEKATGTNSWAAFWGETSEVMFRKSGYRARGPFAHPILAGTVGAVCFPMAAYLLTQNRKFGLIGIASTSLVVLSSGSSGPMLTLIAVVGAMCFWKFREFLRLARWLFVLMIIVLNFVMTDPVYYIVARLDVSAGSTGWFRAYLIQCALEHIGEWWLTGTDYTRHWMPRGLGGSDTAADITNHFIQMGVWAGLPLMFLFATILIVAFLFVGRALRSARNLPIRDQFFIWTLGSILFGHLVTFFSVSYFDPSLIFLFHLLLATIGSLQMIVLKSSSELSADL